ncbi:MAG: VOC family protein [Gammaproteobacteria bacterium]|nr:VOC family protein [Gammaproteobacteria bacterium]
MPGETMPRCVGVRVTVADLDRSAAFYTDLLGFERVTATAEEIELGMGEMRLALRRAAPQALRVMPPDSRANDRWFRHLAIVVRDMAAASERLQTYGVELISREPQTLPDWNPASDGIEALYFRDPDGHPLELIRYPPDKGKAVWRESNEELFLGVDHSAIVVADTAASLAFYRDKIGLSVVGEVYNFGAEQAALSGLSEACVQVTSLLGRGTFGLELIEYVAPRGGRPMPADTGVDDLWWAETLIELDNPEGERRLIRDPDGHTGEIR